MKSIEAVFLDVGGVLIQIDWNRPFEYVGIADPRRRQEIMQGFQGWTHFHLFEKGRISPSEFYSGFNPHFALNRDEETWRQAWLHLIIGQLPEGDKIFDVLAGHVPVHALTNTNVDHYAFQMPRFPILRRFERFFTSFEFGQRKPDAAFYLEAAARVGVAPNHILFIDDSIENVEAARRVGMQAERSENSVQETLDILHSYLPGLSKD